MTKPINNTIKFCFWDCGYVIYPYSRIPLSKWIAEHSLSQNGKPLHLIDFKPLMKGEETGEQFCRKLCDEYQIPFQKDTQKEIFNALSLGIGPIYFQTKQAMTLLSQRGIKNGMISNAIPLMPTDMLNDLPLDNTLLFPSYQTGFLKPDPNVFCFIKEKLNISFDEMLFIDDKTSNVNAARLLGISAIVYQQDTILPTLSHLLDTQNLGAFKRLHGSHINEFYRGYERGD